MQTVRVTRSPRILQAELEFDSVFLTTHCSDSFSYGHIHDEITRRAMGRCLLCTSDFTHLMTGILLGETTETWEWLCARLMLTEWWQGQVGPLCSTLHGRGLLQTAFLSSVGSWAGVLVLSLALLQTSFLWRSAVPMVKQSREMRDVLNGNLSSLLSRDLSLQYGNK